MYVKYKNLRGNSNVFRYALGYNSIIVEFKDGAKYEYTYRSTSKADVEQMKMFAKRGRRLNSYIGRVVKRRFARKWR